MPTPGRPRRGTSGASPAQLARVGFVAQSAPTYAISRASIALHDDNPAERELAERNIRILARNPVNLDNIRRLADALTGPQPDALGRHPH